MSAVRAAFGVGMDGNEVGWNVHEHHTLVVGATGSGETMTTYNLVGSLAGNPQVQVVGVDPSSLTLAPFVHAGYRHRFALGTADMTVAADVLDSAVALMDARIGQLLDLGIDKWQIGPGSPTVVVVMEEFAGTLAAAEAQDAKAERGAPKVRPRIVAAVGRLLRESRKAGSTLLTIIQRPDAAVMGGADRGQYSRRIALRLDNADGVRMIFEGVDPATVLRLTSAPPGVGLISEPGETPRWFRGYLLDYPVYSRYVQTHYTARPVPGLDPTSSVGGDSDE